MKEFVIRLGFSDNEKYLIFSESEDLCFEKGIKLLQEDGYNIAGFKASHRGNSHDDFFQDYYGLINDGWPYMDELKTEIDKNVGGCYSHPASVQYYEELSDDIIKRWATRFYIEENCEIYVFKQIREDKIIKSVFCAEIKEIEPICKIRSGIKRQEWREQNNIDFVSVYLY